MTKELKNKLQVKKIDLDTIKEIISSKLPSSKVWAYGSRVTGKCHSGSDLDLVILDINIDNPSKILNLLKEKFSDSNIPFIVDLRYWDNLPDNFKEEIKKEYIVIK